MVSTQKMRARHIAVSRSLLRSDARRRVTRPCDAKRRVAVQGAEMRCAALAKM
jgi:hypothetical protein